MKQLFPALETLSKHRNHMKIDGIVSPESLLDFMADFRYGWVFNHKRYQPTPTNFTDHYRLMQPEEVLRYKTGVCQDQALFEYDVLAGLGIECRLYFVQQFFTSTHTYCIFKRDNMWYHFENSFARYRGITGPYAKPELISKQVYRNMEEYQRGGKGYLVNMINPSDLLGKYDIDISEFLIICGYDFDRSE